MKKITVLALAALFVLVACDKEDQEKRGGFYKGPLQNFQHGKAWTWMETDRNDKPVRLAIAIDEAAMNSLDPGTGGGGHTHTNGASLAFHPKVSAITPFQHALLDWNPNGHEPAGIYDLPHFDFHFYMSSEAERLAIPLYDVDSTGFLNLPGAGYMPSVLPNLYVPIPGGVPQMGTHWVDVSTPELDGALFTQTFLYGSYNGNVTFYEPMITRQFLEDNDFFQRNIPVPAKFKQAGYYPTKMKIDKSGGVTSIILEGFVYREAS